MRTHFTKALTRLWRLLSIASCLAGTACVSPTAFSQHAETITAQAAEFNLAAATSDRQMIVQNILRARDRESLSFSRISGFSDTMTRQAQGGFTSSLNEGPGNDVLGPNVTLSANAAPRFEVSVPNTQEFNRAIHNSIDRGLYDLFLQQDWQPGLIHMLFIERMTLTCEFIRNLPRRFRTPSDPSDHRILLQSGLANELSGAVTECTRPQVTAITLYNFPTDWGAHTQFRLWLRILMSDRSNLLRLCPTEAEENIGASLPASTDVAPANIVAAQQAGGFYWRRLGKDTNGWQLTRRTTGYEFGLGCTKTERIGAQGSQAATEVPPNQTPPGSTENGAILIRSFEGVIYYLGEALREERAHPDHIVTVPRLELVRDSDRYGWMPTLTSDEDKLFVVRQGDQDGIVVRHHGADFSVPYRADDRSQQVIELTLQLMGMLQTRQDLPVTPVVRLVQ